MGRRCEEETGGKPATGIVRAAPAAAMALVLALPAAAAAQDLQALQALQARMEAMEAQLQAQAAKIDAQAAEIADLKAAQAGQRAPEPVAAPAVVAPAGAATAGAVAIAVPPRPGEATASAGAPALVILAEGRPTIVSTDGNFDVALRALAQLDTAAISQPPAGPLAQDFRRAGPPANAANPRALNSGGTVLRRGRIGLDGRLFRDFDYAVTLEFGGESGPRISAGYVQYNGFAPLHIRVGASGVADGLEGASSKQAYPMLEAASVVDAARSMASGDGRLGVQIFASRPRWYVGGAATGASFTSQGENVKDQIALIGRIAGRPLMWNGGYLHLGTSYSYLARPADSGGPDAGEAGRTVQFRALPEMRIEPTRLINTGPIPAKHAFTNGVEALIKHRNVTLQAEAIRFGVDRPSGALPDPRFFGWYVSGSWMLTGEERRYNDENATLAGPDVAHPFDLAAGTWGSFELTGRYSVLDLNDHAGAAGSPTPPGGVRGGEQRTVSAGLNWYLNPTVRLMFGLQDVRVRRLSPDPVDYLTPVGAEIGQHFEAVTFRSQFGF